MDGQAPLPAVAQLRVTTASALRVIVNVSPLLAPAFAVTVKLVAVPDAALRYAAPLTSVVGIDFSTALSEDGAVIVA